MKKINRLSKLLFIATAYVLVVSGCGSARDSSYATESSAGDFANYDYDSEMAVSESYSDDSNASTETVEVKQNNRKLITNMSMSVETKEFDKTMSFVQSRTEELGGYVENMSVNSYGDDRRYSNLTLRIPEEKLESFVTEVSEKSNITSQSKNVTDVTLSYADIESHKNALRAEEDQLLSFMTEATTIDEILQIQERLTDVRYQLESMESQLRTFDNQITFSTLNINIEEVAVFTPEARLSFLEEAKLGIIDNFGDVVYFFRSLLLLIITHIPTLIVLAIVALIVFFIVRRVDKKSRDNYLSKNKPQHPVTEDKAATTYTPPTYNNDNKKDVT